MAQTSVEALVLKAMALAAEAGARGDPIAHSEIELLRTTARAGHRRLHDGRQCRTVLDSAPPARRLTDR